MNVAKLVKIIGFTALAVCGGALLWGIGHHGSEKAAREFAKSHISFPPPAPNGDLVLVFSCDDSERLVTYELLTDQVLFNREQIKKRTEASSSVVANKPFFGYATGLLVGESPFFLRLREELQRSKARSPAQKFAIAIGIALIPVAYLPVAYLGYLASDWLKLECSNELLYEQLRHREFWAASRAHALQNLFEQTDYCIDRRITLNVPDLDRKGLIDTPIENRDVLHKIDDRSKAIGEWRNYISGINKAVPDQSKKASRVKNARDKDEPTWGDSLYQRIYGSAGFVDSHADFDKRDFEAVISIGERCAKLDTNVAKDLYVKAVGNNIEKHSQ